ncbi:MAG TPA: MarR family transcriptional regulator [Candidatus Dormibacteraeota bacterium]|nr:MarR family transcriptional regulator [Candidatus Dormibacteraeota bacterium]
MNISLPRTIGRGSADRAARQETLDGLLAVLTDWGPRERIQMLTSWHRGSLSVIHLILLTVLEAEGPLSMSRLAEALDVSVASATGIVDRMARRGLVVRRHASDDRRIIMVHLTKRGRTVFGHLEAIRRERLRRALDRLSDDELDGFLRGIIAMRAAAAQLRADAAASGSEDPSAAPPAPTIHETAS